MTGEHEELRRRLRALDPANDPVDPVTSPRALEQMERVMASTDLSEPAVGVVPSRSRLPLLLAAAAVVGALSIGAVLVATHERTPAVRPVPAAKAPTTLALTVPGGITMGSCVPFDVKYLREMPVALAGTVAAADSTQVTLDVDRWYKGGTATRVTIAVPSGQTSAALDGVDFVQGKRYLLTATDGTVNGCGFSGPATPELERSYAEAFPK